MKIEKVNDHQIRCTLTKADLADRELKISELAYGTEKAKSLFRDMMQQASIKFGFEAEDIPLMIEAIPLNSDCIVLIITKVEDPEELDTRFSKFAPSVRDHEDGDDEEDALVQNETDSADDVLDLFKRIKKESSADEKEVKSAASTPPSNNSKVFLFSSLYTLMKPASLIEPFYQGENSLYKDKSGSYLLVLHKMADDSKSFNKACNILSEYGRLERTAFASEAFFTEHYELVLSGHALGSLAKVTE